MLGYPTPQPKPYGPFPAPESYERVRAGVKPALPGLRGRGIVIEPVPVAGFAANFSPIPLIAPPPLGSDIAGKEAPLLSTGASCLPPSFLSLLSISVPSKDTGRHIQREKGL